MFIPTQDYKFFIILLNCRKLCHITRNYPLFFYISLFLTHAVSMWVADCFCQQLRNGRNLSKQMGVILFT